MFGLDKLQNVFQGFGYDVQLYRYLIIGGLIFTRIFVLTMFVPFLGKRPIPGSVRIAVSVILLIFYYSPVSELSTQALPEGMTDIVVLFFKEALFAILIGLAASMVFYGVQAAGGMIDNQRQLANAQIFNPAMGAQTSLFGVFFYQLAIVLVFVSGGHELLFRAISDSFRVMPVLNFPPSSALSLSNENLLGLVIKMAADTLYIALQLSAPVLIAIFIADIILGLTNRVAPMINVFEMGFNIKGFLGVALVFLSYPFVVKQMDYWFRIFIKYLNEVMKWFVTPV